MGKHKLKNRSREKMNESQSVVSVITKGGGSNPFNLKNNGSRKVLASSIRNSNERNLRVSRSNIKLGAIEDLDTDMKVRKSLDRANKKMINIYLKTPYKVMTYDELKKKEKMKDDLLDPPLKLYRAENNLVLHTVFRHNNRLSNTHVNNRTDIFISNVPHNDEAFNKSSSPSRKLNFGDTIESA